jgi:fatty-acyl-CoA synthase
MSPAFATLDDLLAHGNDAHPDAPALAFWDNTSPTPDGGPWATRLTHRFSHGALAQRVRQAAARLWHDWGVRPGDRVAWLGYSHPDQITLLFALAHLGAALVPLNHRLAPAEWVQLLRDCAPAQLLHDGAWAQAAHDLARETEDIHSRSIPCHGIDRLCDPAPAHAAPAGHARADAPALLVYTSGTTGRPKGAVHTQSHLLANMAIAAQVQELRADDRVLTVLPLFHVGGLCIQTLPALYAGASVLLLARFDPADTLAAIAGHRPTLTLQVPATLKALTEHPLWSGTPLESLRAVWAGSSTLPPALIEAFHARDVPVCNVYGATETGPFSIALPASHARQRVGSCGWPAPGTTIRLQAVGAPAAPVGVGEVGEILVRGPNVVQHYWPDQPACDAEGWFHSGDLARRDTDGSHTVVGRAKDMIISGGENIYPAEIEQLLADMPGVAEVAVVGLPDPRWGETVVAVVVRQADADGQALDTATLQATLQDRLARYKQPRRYVFRDALPKTALGKVQKHALIRQIAAEAPPTA